MAVWASECAGIDRLDIGASGVMLIEARWKVTVLKLRLEPPPDRTAEQLENHFEVERAARRIEVLHRHSTGLSPEGVDLHRTGGRAARSGLQTVASPLRCQGSALCRSRMVSGAYRATPGLLSS